MMLLTSLFIASACLTHAQKIEKTISYYLTSQDFVNGKTSRDGMVAKIPLQKGAATLISKISDPAEKKGGRINVMPWSVLMDKDTLFNFRYCPELQGFEVYVKPDIIGEYCVVFADKDLLRTIGSKGPYYGGGLSGALIAESRKWGRNWTDENGDNIKIFINQTTKTERDGVWGKNAIWKILTRKNANDLLNVNLSDAQLETLTIAELRNMIYEKNKKR